MSGQPEPHFVNIDDTVWPVDGSDRSVQWALRYSSADLDREDRLFAASVMSAYAALTNPVYTQKDAIAMLKRARRAVRS